jgi:hypothetical protein
MNRGKRGTLSQVLRFEATSQEALSRYRDEVTRWLSDQGVRA